MLSLAVAVTAAACLLHVCMARHLTAPEAARSPDELHQNDFVFAAPCNHKRMFMARASRFWRKGMRAAFTLETNDLPQQLLDGAARYNETFTQPFPDYHMFPDGKVRHYMPGDRRAAMAPVLAYKALGPTFKWMLFGDDDTIFFMHGAKNMLKHYDPEQPYFLTDMMYEGSASPKPGVWNLKCWPCHVHKPHCNCNSETLCKLSFPDKVQECHHQWEGPVPFGGPGVIYSVGFFKRFFEKYTLEDYTACVLNTTLDAFPQGGDAISSRCFWRFGFPITDIGYHRLGRYLGEMLQLEHLLAAPEDISHNNVTKDLEERWQLGVSLHLEARMMGSWKAATTTVKYISAAYDLVAAHLWEQEHAGSGADAGR